MRLNVGTKLFAATLGALLLMLLLAAGSIYSNHMSQAALAQVFEHTVKPLLAVQAIDRQLQDVRFRVAGVILDQLPRTGSRLHLKEVRAAIPQRWQEFTELYRADDAEASALVKKVEVGMAGLEPLFAKIDKLYDADDRKALEALLEEEWPTVTTQLAKPLNELIALQGKQMGDTYTSSTKLGQRLNATALAILALAVVAMLVGAALIARSITRPLHEVKRVLGDVAGGDLTVQASVLSSDEVATMADSLNTALRTLQQTLSGVHQAADGLSRSADALSGEAQVAREQTGTQTDSVMQISAAMEQLTVSVAEMSGRAKDVAEASARARSIARDSAASVSDSQTTTQRTLDAVDSSSLAVGELSTEIEKISAIAKVIKEIADQTNLLALNAAIEAARAGESGRGFAVVADEVRKLAERTTASTVDITRMIVAIQGKAQSVVQAMAAVSGDVRDGAAQIGQVGESFEHIVEAAEHLTQLAAEIADGTNEQAQVAQQTARSMETISQVAERTGESVNQVAATAVETARTAQELKKLVDRFRVA